MAYAPVFVAVCAALLQANVLATHASPYRAEGVQSARPRFVVQTGHAFPILSAAFSPDGRFVATASFDQKVILWDTHAGAELLRLPHPLPVIGVSFSSDSKRVLTAAPDRARLWDLAAQRELCGFENSGIELKSAVFSSQGDLVITGWKDGSVLTHEASTGTVVRKFQIQNRIHVARPSPDGTVVAVVVDAHTVELHDAVSGAELRTCPWPVNTEFPFGSLAFSPDGRFIATAGGTEPFAFLWDAKSGAEVKRFAAHSEWVKSVAFSPDGTQLLSGSRDGSVSLWTVATGAEVRRLDGPHRSQSPAVFTVSFSPDGRSVLAGGADLSATIWDAASGAQLHALEASAQFLAQARFSPNGKSLVVTTEQSVPLRWDLDSGAIVGTLDHPGARAACYTPDGASVLTAGADSTIKVWDVERGVERRTLTGHTSDVLAVAITRDGKLVAAGASDGTIRLWDFASGVETQRLANAEDSGGVVRSIAFSPDGARLVSSGPESDIVTVWNVSTGGALRQLRGHDARVRHVCFSPDGRFVLSVGDDAIGRLWDAETGAEIRQCALDQDAARTETARCAAFSPDGQSVAIGGSKGVVYVWNLVSGTDARRLVGHQGSVSSIDYSQDGRFIVTASYDCSTRIWDAASGRELCRIVGFPDGNWVVADPEGRFDTNDLDRIRGVHWIMPDDPFKALPIEIYLRDFYEPRLVHRVLSGEQFVPVRDLTSLNRNQPVVRIAGIEPDPDTPGAVSVSVDVSSTGTGEVQSGVFDVRLYRNGQIVAVAPDPTTAHETAGSRVGTANDVTAWREATRVQVDPSTKSAMLRFSGIRLPHSGDVEISAYAFNSDRVKSATARRMVPNAGQGATKGRAYVFAIGVNAYEDPTLDLQFAANDARRTAELVTENLARSGQFADVVPIVLASEQGAPDATKARIKAVVDLLSGRPPHPHIAPSISGIERIRRVGPDDFVFIAFAGHGYADARGDFYLVPYDVGPDARARIGAEANARALVLAGSDTAKPGVLDRCISSAELGDWILDVDAGQIVMVIDACQSGAITGKDFKPGPMGSRSLGQLAYDKGMVILAATQSDNVALELKKLKHGLVTFALLDEGIDARRADFKPKDGTLAISEWLDYAVERVPALQQEIASGKPVTVDGKDARILVLGPGTSPGASTSGVGAVRPLQKPALFNFAKRQHDIVLWTSDPGDR